MYCTKTLNDPKKASVLTPKYGSLLNVATKSFLSLFLFALTLTAQAQNQVSNDQMVVYEDTAGKILATRATKVTPNDTEFIINTEDGQTLTVPSVQVNTIIPLFKDGTNPKAQTSSTILSKYANLANKHKHLTAIFSPEQSKWQAALELRNEAKRKIEDQLAKPYSSTSPASSVIAEMERLAALDPDRKLEIDAYLIPFRNAIWERELQASQTDTSSSSADTDGAKLFVFTKLPNGESQAIRAQKIDTQGFITVVTNSDGIESRMQSSFVVGQLPIYTQEQILASNFDPTTPIQTYEDFLAQNPDPAYSSVLNQALYDFKSLKTDLENKEKAEAEEAMRNLAEIEKLPRYEEGKTYTLEELATTLLSINETYRRMPDLKSEISAITAPYETNIEKFFSGMKVFEGEWRTKQEISAILREREEKKAEALIASASIITIPALAMDQIGVIVVLGILFLSFICILYMLLSVLKSESMGVMHVLSFSGGLIIAGVYIFFAYMAFSAKDPFTEEIRNAKNAPSDFTKIQRILYVAGADKPTLITSNDHTVELTQKEINDFIRHHVTFSGDPETIDLNIYRTDLALQFRDDSILIYEQIRVLGNKLFVRYQMPFEPNDEGFIFQNVHITIGNAPLPSTVASHLWHGLQPVLAKILDERNLTPSTGRYSINEISEGKLTFVGNFQGFKVVAANASTASEKPIPSQAATPSPTSTKVAEDPKPVTPAPAVEEKTVVQEEPAKEEKEEQPTEIAKTPSSTPTPPSKPTPEKSPHNNTSESGFQWVTE